MTVISPMLPGLLSRVGPSLFSPAMVYERTDVRYFSTNTLLDAFLPDPASGSLRLPHLGEETPGVPFGAQMSVRLLGPERVEEARTTVKAVIEDATRIAQEGNNWGLETPLPLAATEGLWSLEEYFGDKDEIRISLKKRGGAFRRVALRSDGGFDLSAGWRAAEAHVAQSVSVDVGGRAETRSFQIEFSGPSAEKLKFFLRMDGRSGQEAALELAARLYASGQYTEGEMGGGFQMLGTESEWYDLLGSDNRWSPPQGMVAEEQNPFLIRTRGSLQETDEMDQPIALADVYWELVPDWGCLSVRLNGLPGRGLMPLAPSLRESLWDGALRFLHGQAG